MQGRMQVGLRAVPDRESPLLVSRWPGAQRAWLEADRQLCRSVEVWLKSCGSGG
jgi:hypothetical protein